MARNSGRPWSPLYQKGTSSDKGMTGPPRQDQKKPGPPNPGTHLSVWDDTDSSSSEEPSLSVSCKSSGGSGFSSPRFLTIFPDARSGDRQCPWERP
jgi:hypothetical protein